MKILKEALNWHEQTEKMRSIEAGTRKDSTIPRMSDEKLWMNISVCTAEKLPKTFDKLIDEAKARHYFAHPLKVTDPFDAKVYLKGTADKSIFGIFGTAYVRAYPGELISRNLFTILLVYLNKKDFSNAEVIKNMLNKIGFSSAEIHDSAMKAVDDPAKLKVIEDLSSESLTEDIEKHETLNPKLWTKDNVLKPEVEEKIKLIVNEFLDGLEKDEIVFDIADVVLVGSNCSYNYTKDSDLDIHILVNMDNSDCPKNLYDKLYSAYRTIFNNRLDIDFYGIPVEIYVEDKNNTNISNGKYSVVNKKWIKEPVAEDIPEIDQEKFDKEFKVWEDRYNEVINMK